MSVPFAPVQGSVRTAVRLNLRADPQSTAAIVGKAEANTTLAVSGFGKGTLVAGNDDWYQGDGAFYFWSGGCGPLTTAAPAALLPPVANIGVHRRPNGTILPLDDAQLRAAFGAFPYTEGTKGRITIDPDWIARNIVTVQNPVMSALGFPNLQLHRLAAAPFDRVMAALVAAGLSGGLLTCAGSFVPRHKGWDPTRGLSSHSWGISVDVNAEWNGYGTTPAALGVHGSCRQFIPYFEAEGFAWGGYFTPPYQDGMHFELARYDLGP